MTKIEETSRRTMNDGTVIVELKNTGNNNPWGRKFTEAALASWNDSLEELWHLSSVHHPTRSSWDFPFTEDSIRMMRENVEFDKAGEPQWRFHRFSTGSRSFRYGIGRLIGRTVHFRNGNNVPVPDGYKRDTENTW